ncbi:MAG: hypothetical protein IT343_06955, partial [Candidatus Melainabacteria bacterium]|nr:hypothetical protein [Candidatus Melainabacteria bacterium]
MQARKGISERKFGSWKINKPLAVSFMLAAFTIVSFRQDIALAQNTAEQGQPAQ